MRLNKDLAFEGLAGEKDYASSLDRTRKRLLSQSSARKALKARNSGQYQKVKREKIEADARKLIEDFVDKEIEDEGS